MIRTTIETTFLGKPVVWPIEDVTHFTASDKYTNAYRADGSFMLITDSLRKLSVELAESFIQVNRGLMVRRDLLTGVKSHPDRMEGVVFVSGLADPIPCGRKYISAVKRYLRERE